MCKCTPNIRTPYCGNGDCVWPEYIQPQVVYDTNPCIICQKEVTKPSILTCSDDCAKKWYSQFRIPGLFDIK